MIGVKAGLRWAPAALAAVALTMAAGLAQAAETVLFIGNSFTYGANSPVWKYRGDSVTDLNGGGVGGVPALFKLFAKEAGLDYEVSLETAPGQGPRFHCQAKLPLLGKAWDHVVMHGLQHARRQPSPAIRPCWSTPWGRWRRRCTRNPKVDIHLTATWSRADETYLDAGHWHGQPIDSGAATSVKPTMRPRPRPMCAAMASVGDAWTRAIAVGFMTPIPTTALGGQGEPVGVGQLSRQRLRLLSRGAGGVRAADRQRPASLGARETELGISPPQASALQQIAHDEIAAYHGR